MSILYHWPWLNVSRYDNISIYYASLVHTYKVTNSICMCFTVNVINVMIGESDDSSDAGAIAGGVVAALLVVAIILLVLVLVFIW